MSNNEEQKTKWPVIRTVRKLQVPLSDDDIRNLGRENAHIGAEIDALTAAKKASAQNYTAQITERSTRRSVNDTAISNGWSEKEIECEWRYELNRKGIADKARKILVRLDTEKVVDEAFITDDERQTTMKLDPAPESQPEMPGIAAETPADAPKAKKGKKAKATAEAAQEADKKDSDAEAKANE